MLKNYLTIAVRNLLRHKGYTLINIAGLTVGITCCLLIFLFVQHELNYDRHNTRADRIYRVVVGEDQVVTPTAVAPVFKRAFPEVEQTTRLYDVGSFRPVVIRYGDEVYQEHRFAYADSTVFDVFTLPFIAGNPHQSLVEPNSIVLSRSAAQKYFHDEDPLGKVLTIGSDQTFRVTGVMEDIPTASHFRFDFLASFSTLHWANEEIWDSANFGTYVLLRESGDAVDLEEKIAAYLQSIREKQPGLLSNDYQLSLQPLTRIHLYVGRRITYVYLFSAIALFILLIACINYLNLATARAGRRSKEVGVRKLLGANRPQLARQFLAESALTTTAAIVVGFAVASLLLPYFNALSGKQLTLNLLHQPLLAPGLLALGGTVTLLAGSYPAFFLSSFQPADVLKSTFLATSGGRFFRRSLVTFQFAVSICLIATTCIVYLQLQYVRSRDLGFSQDQVVILPIGDQQTQEHLATLKDAFLQHPHILHASAVNSTPGYQRGGYGLIAEGLELPEGEFFPIRGVPADKDVVETLGLNLVAGQGFPKTDSYAPDNGTYAYLINEATARALGWTPEQAIGKKMGVSPGRMGEVVGVIEDYHYASLHETIEPLTLFIGGEWDSYEYLLVKIAPEDIPGTLDFLRKTWRERVPYRPFDFTFLDEQFNALYRDDQRTGEIIAVFSALAIFIAGLGLFGLATFAADSRTKEIGVRKVLGASVPSIVMLLSREFIVLILIGLAAAVPLAYIGMNRWLENFAYRIDMPWEVFPLAGLAALFVALLTVSYQAIQAALADPVKSLRYE